MTKTNSLKKALAGILAACMAATTLVAAPFTFGNSQNVGAASLDEMELLAQYSFESGYTDSVSGDTATATGTDAGAVTLQKEENGNTYLSIANESSFANNIKNYVEYDNPMKGVSSTNGFTIAMKIRLHDAALQTNSWEGLWCVANGVGPENAFAGMLPGGFRFNAGNNVFYDYTNEQHPELNPGISAEQFSEVVATVGGDGTLNVYVDGDLKYTVGTDVANASQLISFLTQQDKFYLGFGTTINAWCTAGADYDDVRIYSGAADAEVAAAIYEEATPEAVICYDFENGIGDYPVTGTVEAVEDEIQGNVVNVASDYTTYPKNYITFDNPFKNSDLTEATVSMNVKLTGTAVNSFEAHWGFANNVTETPLFALSGDGSLHYNGAPGYFDQATGLLSLDDCWHKVAVVIKNDGSLNTYVDGVLKVQANITNLISGADATTITDLLNSAEQFYLGIAGTFWGSAGASYDNVAFYDTALTDLEIANLPGTAQIPGSSEEEPEEPMDPAQPYLLTKDEGKWQVIDGQSINTTTKNVTGYITGNNFSISGWMNFNSISGNNMYLFQMQGGTNSAHGVRFSTSRDGALRTWLMNNNIDTSWDSEQLLPVGETFLFTLNYDGDNHTITVYINNEVYFTYTNENTVVPATDYSMANIVLGTSQWSDPTLDGRMADLYISNNLISTDDIAAKVTAADYPDWDDTSAAIIPLIAERENLNIVELGTKADGTPTTVTYDNSDKDSAGHSKITEVNGQAKAQLSTEKYEAETLSTNDVTVDAGYREFDTSAFLANADDFTVTSWVHWYGDGTTTWGGKQTLTAQRFFDLFNIKDEDQSKYEFYFNGWEENYYDRNPSVSSTSEIQEAVEELGVLNNNPNVASSESGVYLCGISAGATLNGLNRPCFRPGKTFVSNGNQTNSGLPYQWAHVAVVYDADGHVGSDGTVYGASLTYYVDSAAYATRYFDYADFDTSVDEFYQSNSSPKDGYFIDEDHTRPENADAQIVGGSVDGADIIYGIANAEALKVKNMALDTLYLGKSTDSDAYWNGEYRNAYLYNYALTSGEVGEDYVDLVKPLEGASMETPTEANNITTDGNIYALINESTNASKTMELGFNTEWLNTSAYRGTSSLSFNGDGGYAEVDTSLLTTDGQPIKEDGSNVSDQFTFSTWVNLSDTLNWGRIFDIKGDNGELFLSNNGYFNNDANVGLGLRSSTLENGIEVDKIDVSNGTSINAGTWVNVTVVIDGTDVSLYFQGELEITGKLTMPLSEMGIHTFYLSRSAAVDGKYGLPLDPDNDMVLDETYLLQDALSDAQVLQLAKYGYAGAKTSTTQENSTRLEMLDVADLFDADRNVDTYYVDITDHKTLSAEVMNALANSTGKTLYVRVEQGVSYDFIWELTSEAFAGRTYSASDEFDLLVSGANMSSADATTILTKWSQKDPTANVNLQAQTITVYANKLPVELPLFINYNRDFLQTVDNGDGTQTLKDVPLNLYKGTASSYSLVQKGLKAATDQDGNTLMQNYTNPTTNANGTVVQYYVQNLTEGGSFILTPQTLP